MFPLVAGLSVAAVVLGACAWGLYVVRRDLPPGGLRQTLLLGLAFALVSIPVIPSPTAPLRVDRVRYAGPDLLSDAPVEMETRKERWVIPALVQERELWRVQAGTLLDEFRRVEVRVPWLLLLVLLGILGLRGRGRAPASRLLVSALLGAGLVGCAPEDAPSRAELLLAEVIEMRRSGETGAVLDVFLPEAVYDDHGNGVQYRGAPEIAGYLGSTHRWASDLFLDVVRVHPAPGWAAAEWVLEGVQTGPIPGQLETVTNRRFRLGGLTLVEVERGGVVRAADYLDMTPLLLDLGAEIRLPDGGVLTVPEPGREDQPGRS